MDKKHKIKSINAILLSKFHLRKEADDCNTEEKSPGYCRVLSALSGKGLEILAREGNRKAKQIEETIDLTTGSKIQIYAIKNARDLMALPLFSTCKEVRMENIEYTCNLREKERYLVVSPDEKLNIGIANERDADIIRYAISKIYAAGQLTGHITNKVAFTRYEVLKAIGKAHNSKSYKWIEESIVRIATTNYKTNIWTEQPNDYFCGNLASFYFQLDENKDVEKVKMMLCDPLYRHLQKNQILTIDNEIIKESGYFKKKLREVVQVHMGNNRTDWTASIEKIRKLTAYRKTLRRIKDTINKIDIPYRVEFSKGKLNKNKTVTFYKN